MSAGGLEALQPQDLVLTIFGAHVRRHEMVWSGGMVEVLRALGFSSEAARAALARLVGRDLLARHKDGRLVFYTSTPRAEALLADGDERIWTFGRDEPADDLWTVVWHAIPEGRRVERSRFASRLRFLGFGSIQDATWLAAHDRSAQVEQLAHALGIEAYTSVFVGRVAAALPAGPVVAQAWDVAAVRERYDRFVAEYGPFRRARARGALTDEGAFATRIAMLHRFRSFPSSDPELPADADGLGRARAEVVATFDEVYGGLEEAATRYFVETAAVRAAAA